MTNKSLKKYDELNHRFWEWLVKYGYSTEAVEGKHSLKEGEMWSEVFKIRAEFEDLQEELKAKIEALPNEVIYEIAKKILVPHGIDLDHIAHKHVEDL